MMGSSSLPLITSEISRVLLEHFIAMVMFIPVGVTLRLYNVVMVIDYIFDLKCINLIFIPHLLIVNTIYIAVIVH